MEFAFIEEAYSFKRKPLIIFVCVFNNCRTVGDSVVESAELQCHLDLIHLLDWSNWVVLSEGMNNCPLEIFLAVKGVDLEVVKIIVEREAGSQLGLDCSNFSLITLALFSLFMFS